MPLNKDIATKNHRTTSQYLVDSKNDEPINTSTSIPSSKSTKKGSSSSYITKKTSKSIKHDVGQDTKAPTGPPFDITGAPTSEFSFLVEGIPYELYFSIRETASGTSGEDDLSLSQVSEITRLFLEQYVMSYYSKSSIINLDNFLTNLVDYSDDESKATFFSIARFNPSSIFYPPSIQIQELVREAFSDSNSLFTYRQMLQRELPITNIFRTTTAVTYAEVGPIVGTDMFG